jgi:hypothetical protein
MLETLVATMPENPTMAFAGAESGECRLKVGWNLAQ